MAYSVTADHSRQILSVTVGHPGSRNDKTIIQFDKYVQGLRSGTLYPDKQFNVFNERGRLVISLAFTYCATEDITSGASYNALTSM